VLPQPDLLNLQPALERLIRLPAVLDDENPKRVSLEAADDPPVSHTQSAATRIALHRAELRSRIRMGLEILELGCDPNCYRIVEPIEVPLGSLVKLDVHSCEPALAKIFL
jgi:hypothetical protein